MGVESADELKEKIRENMLAEQESMASAGPEKTAILEAMKKGFYDDMHKRMEQFFSQSHSVAH